MPEEKGRKRWWEISHLTLVHCPVNVYLPHLRDMIWYLQAICRERPGCIWWQLISLRHAWTKSLALAINYRVICELVMEVVLDNSKKEILPQVSLHLWKLWAVGFIW